MCIGIAADHGGFGRTYCIGETTQPLGDSGEAER